MTLGPLTSSPATTTGFTRSLMWQRMDGAGTDIVMVAGTSAIYGHGTVTAARPLPHVDTVHVTAGDGKLHVSADQPGRTDNSANPK